MNKPNQAISTCKNCGNCKKKEKGQLPVKQCDHEWSEITANGDFERKFICIYCSKIKPKPFNSCGTDSCSDIRNHISQNTKVIEK